MNPTHSFSAQQAPTTAEMASALVRLSGCYRATLAGKPVRDADEVLELSKVLCAKAEPFIEPAFDNTQAESEGWFVSKCSGSECGSWQIQRDDQEGVFANDDDAWTFVLRKAQKGSQYHLETLAFVLTHNPCEVMSMAHHAGASGIDMKKVFALFAR